jgi:hypothetical protein
VQALPELEVHVDGANHDSPVFEVTGNHIKIIGLRIYGAGNNKPNIRVSETAVETVIAGNVIGDPDKPSGNCGASPFSGYGIDISSNSTLEEGQKRVWIYGNVIECHRGTPGHGINIATDGVTTGAAKEDNSEGEQRNIIRDNSGYGINLDNNGNNEINYNDLASNNLGPIHSTNFSNDFFHNKIE